MYRKESKPSNIPLKILESAPKLKPEISISLKLLHPEKRLV